MTNPSVFVPNWQRSYSWTTSEVETFWSDIVQFSARYPNETISNEEYFLGSVVIVESQGGHLLLDGQQRLATSAILFSVIRDFLNRYKQDAALRLSSRYLTDFDDASGQHEFKMALNQYDKDFFKREVLEFRGLNYQPPTATMDSHRLIRKAREHLQAKFEGEYSKSQDAVANFNWSLRILRVLANHVSVVAVFSADEDNAATVFETLNDRGIGLSTPDLLRNFILRRAREQERDEIIRIWGEILELEDDFNLKLFIRHFWISHYGDIIEARTIGCR